MTLAPEQITALMAAFSTYDDNKDGTISYASRGALMADLDLHPQLQDISRHGRINFADFLQLMGKSNSSHSRSNSVPSAESNPYRMIFNGLDKDSAI